MEGWGEILGSLSAFMIFLLVLAKLGVDALRARRTDGDRAEDTDSAGKRARAEVHRIGAVLDKLDRSHHGQGAVDQDGVPKWWIRDSLTHTIEDLAENTRKQTTLMEKIVETQQAQAQTQHDTVAAVQGIAEMLERNGSHDRP